MSGSYDLYFRERYLVFSVCYFVQTAATPTQQYVVLIRNSLEIEVSVCHFAFCKTKTARSIKGLFHFEFDNGGKVIDLFTKIDEVTMQVNLWSINKHFHANCPINFASQTTSVELGMDKVALPMVSVITVAEGLGFSATVILLKAEDSIFLGLSKLLRRA
jgi:hypothetical protein